MKRILILFLCALLLMSGVTAMAAQEPTTEELIDSVLSACLAEAGADSVQEWIDGDLADGAGTRGEWYVIGLSQYKEEYDFSRYRKALEKYVAENEIRSATSRQRVALTFLAVGGGEDFIAEAASNSIGELGIMSYVFGLHLIHNGVDCPGHSAESVVKTILDLELTDGGWAVRGDVAEADTTAMVIQALASYYETNEPVKAAVDRALATLSARQLPNGCFESYGTANPESAAQVMTALCTLGRDPRQEESFIKKGTTLLDGVLSFRLPEGNFAHSDDGKSNNTATLQAFYNLVALWRFEQGMTPFHILDGPGEMMEKGISLPQDYRFWVAVAALVLGLLWCLVLFIRGRRNPKNYAFLMALALLAAVGIQFIQLEKTENYYGTAAELGEDTIQTTLTIRCDTVAGEREHIPADGIVLDNVSIEVNRGASALDQLVSACRTYNIHMEHEGGVSDYVSGLAYLYEYEFGDMSGWMLRVNGVLADVGCGAYTLEEGDSVEWLYSREMGEDLN